MPKGGIQRYNGAPPAAASPGQVAASIADQIGQTPSSDPLAALLNPSTLITIGSLPAAASSGDVVVFEDGANAGVYICTTPYTSGGTLATNWTKVTDPATIAIIMATASAFGAAGVAQASADGKNTIRYTDPSLLPPSTTTAGVLGDTIFGISGARVVAQYKLTGISGGTYTWTSVQLDSAVIASLDVGKITGAIANFVYAAITQLTVLQINAQTTTWTTVSNGIPIATTITGTGITTTLNGNPFPVKIRSGLSVDGTASASSFSTGGDITASGNISTPGYVTGGHLQSTASATSTAGANVYMDSGGFLHQTSGSSRTIKHDIEPFEAEYDLAALDACGVFAFHYNDDPEGRTVISFVVENMLEAGLRRYVDFDAEGQPRQPAWQQITALHTAALKQARRDIVDLKAAVARLQEPS